MQGFVLKGLFRGSTSELKRYSFSGHDLGDEFMKISVFTPLVILVCALSLAACANTVRGVGKDVKDTGRAVQQAVQ